MRYDSVCYRLTLYGGVQGMEHILVGSEESARFMLDRIRNMPQDAEIDWGDSILTVGSITDYRIEKIRFSQVS